MKNYNSENIRTALGCVGIEKSDVVMMHSSPLALGRFAGENLPQEVIGAIRRCIGESGTLIVPAFNFEFCKGSAFNRQKSPSKNMGVLSEALRLMPDAKRSCHPMQSIAAVGKLAGDICERDTPSAFSGGGSFDRLLELNAKLLLFGVNFNAASFLHYAEEKYRVPYRYDKKFSGEYIDEGVSEQREYQMYVRDLDLNPQLDLRNLERRVEANGKLKRAKLGIGEILVCNFADLYEAACEMLETDRFIFLKNRDEVAERLDSQVSRAA